MVFSTVKYTREDCTKIICEARREKGLSWNQIATDLGKPKVWSTSACLGQHPFPEKDAKALIDLLDLDPAMEKVLQEVPHRGSKRDVPNDPTIYRVHEATQVYGDTIKALIHEEFGDGIMSAINFSMDIEKEKHPAGDRVKIIYSGKFLPYAW